MSNALRTFHVILIVACCFGLFASGCSSGKNPQVLAATQTKIALDVYATITAEAKARATQEVSPTPSLTTTPTASPTTAPTASPTTAPTASPTPEVGKEIELGQIDGKVVDHDTNETVEGAQLVLGKDAKISNSAGEFHFKGVTPGPQVIVATKDGYETASTSVFLVDSGETKKVTIEMFPSGTFSHPEDPMATNQIDPDGAQTKEDAIRLARLQGLTGPIDAVEQQRLTGEYLVNYKLDGDIHSARASLDHEAWALTSGGSEWYVVKVCGNLAVPIPKYSPILLVSYAPSTAEDSAVDAIGGAVVDSLKEPTPSPVPTEKSEPASIPAPTVYFFYGDWCGYSRQAAAIVGDVEAKYRGRINFVRVTVDRNFHYDSAYEIDAVPSFVWVDASGRVVNHVSGVRNASYFDDVYRALSSGWAGIGPCTTPGIQVTWPPADSKIYGRVHVYGTIAINNFQYYKLEYWAANSPGWTYLLEKREPVENGEIFMLDTRTVPNGRYGLRITAVYQNGNYPEPCEIWWNVAN
jgi:thiol-disulfide isomerase/thioredoxin